MRVLIAGGSGLIGRALMAELGAAGHDVRQLVRRPTRRTTEIRWDPARGEIPVDALAGIDAVVNLSGENVGAGRWTAARRERILRSRVDATRTLVVAMTKCSAKPSVLISASAVGYYGDRGDETLTERSSIGHGFLPEVCLAWETHAEGATRLGIRTAILRFGVVLAAHGGALAKMLPLFRLGLGGRFGSGRQWMSWIALTDAVGVITAALTNDLYRGALNVVAPNAVTNAQFALTLARVLRRPLLAPAPVWALRLVFGQMADETILSSARARPAQLERWQHPFRQPELEGALRAGLHRTRPH
jgi:uncharacterized protein (TIGR01777 family)